MLGNIHYNRLIVILAIVAIVSVTAATLFTGITALTAIVIMLISGNANQINQYINRPFNTHGLTVRSFLAMTYAIYLMMTCAVVGLIKMVISWN